MKVNINGASRINLNRASYGGLIRNSLGVWISGFSHKLEDYISLKVEIWGILGELDLFSNKGYKHVILESNSLLLTDMLKKKTSSGSINHTPLLDWYQEMLRKN